MAYRGTHEPPRRGPLRWVLQTLAVLGLLILSFAVFGLVLFVLIWLALKLIPGG